jgi:hypothetical protein
LAQSIIGANRAHNHMLGYRFPLDGDLVEMQPKLGNAPAKPPSRLAPLHERVLAEAKRVAPGWDIYSLDHDWRDWVDRKQITRRSPAAPLVAFCKRRGRYPSFR